MRFLACPLVMLPDDVWPKTVEELLEDFFLNPRSEKKKNFINNEKIKLLHRMIKILPPFGLADLRRPTPIHHS